MRLCCCSLVTVGMTLNRVDLMFNSVAFQHLFYVAYSISVDLKNLFLNTFDANWHTAEVNVCYVC